MLHQIIGLFYAAARHLIPLQSARHIVAIVSLLSVVLAVRGQGGEYCRHLTMADGLSHPSVMAITQDRLGRMWFGTREGLNIYDGSTIVSFKGWVDNPRTGTTDWLGNEVDALTEDSDGNIIALIDGDIICFNIREEYFSRITDNGNITALAGYRGYVAWVAGDSLFTLGENHHPRFEMALDGVQPVSHISFDDTNMYLSTDRGLVAVDRRNGKRTVLLENRRIYASLVGRDGSLWITAPDEGLFHRAPSASEITHVSSPPKSSSHNTNIHQIRNAVEDKCGRIWYGAFTGLYCYDPATSRTHSAKMPPNAGGLSHSSVFGMYCDRDGNIWAGTYYGGVNFLSPDGDHSVNFAYDTETPPGLSMSLVVDMVTDRDGNLWFGTDGAGVCCVDAGWNILQRLSTQNPHGSAIKRNNIKALAYDSASNRIYIGTHLGGLSFYDIESRTTHNFLDEATDDADSPGNVIHDLAVVDGHLIISSREGLTTMNISTGRFHRISSLAPIKFDIDSKGDLWAISPEGVSHIQNPLGAAPRTSLLVPQGQLGRMVCVLCMPDGLYVGTHGNGLHYFRGYTSEHRQLHIRNSHLPSNYCYALAPLGADEFVMVSPRGVSASRLAGLDDIRVAEFERLSLAYFFPESHLIEGCCLLPKNDGDIFVGSTRGISLLPGRGKSRRPRPFFSQLYVGGHSVSASDGSGILDTSLPMASRITLTDGRSDFTIRLGLARIGASTGSPEVEYRLDGRDDEGQWHSAPAAWPVSYALLTPGKYRLRLRLADRQGATSQQDEIGLDVIVPIPWYASWWAVCLYAFAVGMVVFLIVRKSIDAARLRSSLKREQAEHDQIERLNREKFVFFTNISHEFQTPLTLILSHADLLLSRYRRHGHLADGLGKIRLHAEQMSHLVTQLLEFRKLQQGHQVLRIGHNDASEALRRAAMPFVEYAASRGMSFAFDGAKVTALFDPGLLDRVLVNIISNAFKYTNDGGKVICRAEPVAGGGARIVISDTGRGISEKDLPFVFDRFYNGSCESGAMPPADYHTTGIGLAFAKSIVDHHHGTIEVRSVPGEGSTFTVTLSDDVSLFSGDANVVLTDTLSSQAMPEIIAGKSSTTPIPTRDAFCEKENEGKPLILIVEDNVELRSNLSSFFAPFYAVEEASDGQEGLEKTRVLTPALVISDVMMPVMSGIELCRTIKTDINVCHTPVILLTALGATESKLEGLRADADDYVTKPFDSALLLARVDNLLRAAARRRESWASNTDTIPSSEMDAPNPLDRRLLRKVRDTVSSHIADPELDVALLCREAGVGRSALFVKLKALTGLTPAAFIARERMAVAAELLKSHPHLTVEDVADRCGFASAVYFRRCFKERYGDTPAQYRKTAVHPVLPVATAAE